MRIDRGKAVFQVTARLLGCTPINASWAVAAPCKHAIVHPPPASKAYRRGRLLRPRELLQVETMLATFQPIADRAVNSLLTDLRDRNVFEAPFDNEEAMDEWRTAWRHIVSSAIEEALVDHENR